MLPPPTRGRRYQHPVSVTEPRGVLAKVSGGIGGHPGCSVGLASPGSAIGLRLIGAQTLRSPAPAADPQIRCAPLSASVSCSVTCK